MLETLFIRLGSKAQNPIHWLIYSNTQQDIIASGELSDAKQLVELSEKAQQRKVTVFVPSCDIALKSLKVPGKSQRAIRSAVPYILEDNLAQEVESLFFAYANLKTNELGENCFVAAVSRTQLKLWQTWLSDANIVCKTMIPDVLAMPLVPEKFSAIALGEQVLIRQSLWQGMTLDANLWEVISQQWQKNPANIEQIIPNINCYSSLLHSENLNIQVMPEELPMALLAQHASAQSFNLLQGEFQIKEKRSPALMSWLWVAGIASFTLLMNVGIKGTELIQLNNQQQQVEQQIIDTYKKAFPETKRVRIATIKSQLKQKMSEVGSSSNSEGFLEMLGQLQPALASVPELKPETIKFDGKSNEIRMQAVASDYKYFDSFRSHLEKANFKVSPGAQNNQGDEVTGSFSISGERKKS